MSLFSLIRTVSLVASLMVPSLAFASGFSVGVGSSLTVKENDNSPSVTGVNSISFTNGTVTDNGSGSVSVTISGVGAPTDATYITQTANGTLSGEQALGSLATGCMASTTTTGVVATRTITGTANEVSVANGDCSGTPTISLPATIDLGGKTSFEIPNGAAPTTDAFGEIAGDNNAWAASRGTLQIYDGTANTLAVNVLASDAPTNGECPKWNTGGTITWETCSGSGSVATDAIWDAAGDLAVGSGANTAARLAMGTGLQVLRVNAGATALEWADNSASSGLTHPQVMARASMGF